MLVTFLMFILVLLVSRLRYKIEMYSSKRWDGSNIGIRSDSDVIIHHIFSRYALIHPTDLYYVL